MPASSCFNVTNFGALGDGRSDESAAIALAIEACAKHGGGRVLFPAGTYLTGPIELKSHIELHLEAGATVLFTSDFEAYPLRLTHFEGQETVACTSPLWGVGLEHIALTGEGTFDGQGEFWRPIKRLKLQAHEWESLVSRCGHVNEEGTMWWPTRAACESEAPTRRLRASGKAPCIQDFLPLRDFLRPNMVKFTECRNVIIDGPTFQNSPCWNVHLLFCENVTVKNATILNPWYAANGDGLDIESCRNVEVYDCLLDVGDDAICLKSGKDEQGRLLNRPCENIVVKGCTVIHGHGGLTVGSEMSGGIRNVRVSNCTFRGTDVGLRFKTVRGRGGIVEDIEIHDITMSEVAGPAISFDMAYRGFGWGEEDAPPPTLEAEPVNEGTPQFRNITMRDIYCEGAKYALEVRGLPEMPIAHIVLQDAHLNAENGIVVTDAQHVTLRNLHLETSQVPAVRCQNVRQLTLEKLDCTTVSRRPAPGDSRLETTSEAELLSTATGLKSTQLESPLERFAFGAVSQTVKERF